jgi:hypothetical protein
MLDGRVPLAAQTEGGCVLVSLFVQMGPPFRKNLMLFSRKIPRASSLGHPVCTYWAVNTEAIFDHSMHTSPSSRIKMLVQDKEIIIIDP